jgi:hypothetical protein
MTISGSVVVVAASLVGVDSIVDVAPVDDAVAAGVVAAPAVGAVVESSVLAPDGSLSFESSSAHDTTSAPTASAKVTVRRALPTFTFRW